MTTEKLQQMTDEEKRIRIAELCGWRDIHPCTCNEGNTPRGYRAIMSAAKHIPDYLNDLNAMHAAEKVLTTKKQWDQYCPGIVHTTDAGVTSDQGDYFNFRRTIARVAHATARQRADAFLLTLGP